MDQVMWGSEDWKSLLQENIRRSEIGDQAGVDNPFTKYGIFFFLFLSKIINQGRKGLESTHHISKNCKTKEKEKR